jgi:lysophospholipase L1-like esterase/predicted esterase
MKFVNHLLKLLLLGSFYPTAAHASPAKLRVALLGDSITRGVLADDSLGEKATVNDIVDFARMIANGSAAGYMPEKEGVLNFKLMSANEFLARDELAAVQGKESWSVLNRLQAEKNISVDFINAAKLGGSFRMADLQLAVLDRAMKSRGFDSMDLVIVDLGRIDLSIFTSEADFQNQLDTFVGKLAEVSPQSRVIFTKIADIPGSIARANRVSTSFAGALKLTCRDIFTAGGVAGKTGLVPGTENAEALARAQARRDAYNKALASKVSELAAAGVTVSLVETISERSPDAWDAIMASDCIHLNANGQREIANKLFPAVVSMSEAAAGQLPEAVQLRSDGLSDEARAQWDSYLASLPLDQLQTSCRPMLVEPEGAYKGSVLLFHGFTACPQQFTELAAQLSAKGYAVFMPLNPGHGRKFSKDAQGKNTDNLSDLPTGRANDSNSYLKYFDFVRQMNSVIRATSGEHIVSGLSLGAAMATFATIQEPNLWDRQLIMSPLYELDQAPVHNLMGTLSNINNVNQTVGRWLDPILNTNQGWGEGCENERTPSWVAQFGRDDIRGGICQFKITHVLGANQFGFDVWSLMQPTRIKTQFVVVQDDPVINKQLVFNGVGRLRSESMPYKAFTSKNRLDNDDRARVCYIPSSNTTCATNMNKPWEQQALPCANHSLLSRFDAPNQNKYWIDILLPKVVDFISEGEFFEAGSTRAHNDPVCAGFPGAN